MPEQRGSVLMLMPAAVLVFIVLGALCVDFGAVYVSQRELSNAAAAAANDAATQAMDLQHFYATGEVRLVHDVAREVAERSVAAKGLEHLGAEIAEVTLDPVGTRVTVVVRGRVRYLFARAVPGGPEHADITASSEAEATEIEAG